jgi:predicted GTPase
VFYFAEYAFVMLWDGGNNDLPFYKPNLWLCIADPLRPGHEVTTLKVT